MRPLHAASMQQQAARRAATPRLVAAARRAPAARRRPAASAAAAGAAAAAVPRLPARPGPVLVWHKHDLRTEDHPGLLAAAAAGAPVVPVFCLDPRLYAPLALQPGGVEGALLCAGRRAAAAAAPCACRAQRGLSGRGWLTTPPRRRPHTRTPAHPQTTQCCTRA